MLKEAAPYDAPRGSEPAAVGPRDSDRLRQTRLAAAIFSVSLCLLALLDHALNYGAPIQPAFGLMAVNPLAASAFMVIAAALAIGPSRYPWLVRTLAGVVILGGGAKLFAFTGAQSLGADWLVSGSRFLRSVGSAASAMPSATALCLIGMGTALVVSGSRHRRAVLVSQVGCVAVIAAALLAAVGHVLDIFRVDGAIQIAIPFYSTLVLMLLAAGIASLDTQTRLMRTILDRDPSSVQVRSAFPFALLALVLIGTEAGSWPTVLINLGATLALMAGCIFALYRTDRLRRSSERAMALSEGHYRHAQQVGHIGHWRIDYASGENTWSDEVYEIFGLPRTTVPSLEMKLALHHPDDRQNSREMLLQAISDGRGWEINHGILRPDGSVRHIKSYGVCEKDAAGTVTAIFGVVADITELQLARREAEAATASKAAFLANMSHEIRTPMNGVMGFVELLMDSKLNSSQRRHLTLVQESAQALLKLLNDILDLSKIEASQLDLSAEPSNIRHDLTQCVRLMTPIAEQKGLDIRAIFADGFPTSVLIDSLRLRQILFNLLGNAVKFTNTGSVSVTLGEGPPTSGKRSIVIKVVDTGVGIAEERKAAIFDAFAQADASISRRFGGSGLGLSISRSLAHLMGGTIVLDSEEGVGTTVTLLLPLDEVFAPALADVLHPLLKPGATVHKVRPMSRQASILLVEDIDINQELITEMLVRLGHTVELATNGAEALALAHRLQQQPDRWDIILMDVQMPVMDGLAATRAIRALAGRAAAIPIIALTANAFATEMQDCRDAGMNDHIAKPSSFAALKQAIELWGDLVDTPPPDSGFLELDVVSVAGRFEARLRKSHSRLATLLIDLRTANAEMSGRLLDEAAGIAHVLAGTAAMFRQGALGEIAREVESDLLITRRPEWEIGAAIPGPINRLIAALESSIKGSDQGNHYPASAEQTGIQARGGTLSPAPG